MMMALPWLLLNQGSSGSFLALVTLSCTISSFFLTPLFATFIDRYSRKGILRTVQVLQISSASLVALATFNGVESHWLIASVMYLFWLTNDLAWCTNNALIQENYQKSEYAKYSSYQEVVFQTTSLGIGGLGIVLLQQWSLTQFAVFTALCGVISLISFTLMPYQRQIEVKQEHSFSAQLIESKTIILRDTRLFLFLALSCLGYPALTYLSKLLPIYFYQNSIDASWFASWSLSYGAGALICGLVASKLLAQYATDKAMMICLVVVGAIICSMGLFPTAQYIVAITLIMGFFSSYNRIARTYKMNLEVKTEERGRMDGGLKLFSTFSQSLSYVLIAVLSHIDSIEFGFVIVGGVLLLASGIMYRHSTAQPLAKALKA